MNIIDANPVQIHPSAVVEKGAELAAGVTVGPFCHIGPAAKIGENVELISHVAIIGETTIGAGTRIFPNAVIGSDAQNVAYKGETTTLVVGENVLIREGVTMNRGTGNSRGTTIVGDNSIFLAYSHVAHDSIVGSNVTFANNVMIGGHCTIGDGVIIGGGAGVHQFCTVGHHAFIGGIAAVVNDVIPYGMVVGSRAFLAGLNLVGMKRSGMARQDINAVRGAYKELFADSDKTLREKAALLKTKFSDSAAAVDMLDFILADSKRKFITPITAQKTRDHEGI
ncbi:MAG: acyl-ACP--UDP-N-acetylglucosamine O-acyltransferase [Pseudomonadota bacterium]